MIVIKPMAPLGVHRLCRVASPKCVTEFYPQEKTFGRFQSASTATEPIVQWRHFELPRNKKKEKKIV